MYVLRRPLASWALGCAAFVASAASSAEPQPTPTPPPSVVGVANFFNPQISVIGDFLAASGKNPVDPSPSIEMHEAEVSFQAIVDPYARADFFFAYGDEGAEIEEGFITFTSLPGAFLLKAGKLKASFGKVNTMHTHVLSWTDRPRVVVSLLGGEEGLSDSGVSLSRLLPNRFLFLEATAEVYRGESELFQAPRRRDLTYVGHVRAYRDLTEASNLDLGASYARGSLEEPGSKGQLVGADATFRWRPLRRAIYRRFLARTELVWSRREDASGRRDALGAYASAEYQFARRWFVGGRVDHSERADEPDLVDKGGSALLTFWPSEFSQVRAQLRRTRYAEGSTANEALVQILFSIGAHGAHPF